MTIAVALWHIHFEGDTDVALHVCEIHKAIGTAIPCADQRPDSEDCAHVQFRRCDCFDLVPCDGCKANEHPLIGPAAAFDPGVLWD